MPMALSSFFSAFRLSGIFSCPIMATIWAAVFICLFVSTDFACARLAAAGAVSGVNGTPFSRFFREFGCM